MQRADLPLFITRPSHISDLLKTDRIKKRFAENIFPEPMSGCWIFDAAPSRGAYRVFGIKKNGSRFQIGAHRASWIIYRGNIPCGKIVCHSCDNPACVNPDHLFLGSHSDNNHDCIKKGRHIDPVSLTGEAHLSSVLKEKDIPYIRNSNKSLRGLAREFSVCKETIKAVKLGRTWKHVRCAHAT